MSRKPVSVLVLAMAAACMAACANPYPSSLPLVTPTVPSALATAGAGASGSEQTNGTEQDELADGSVRHTVRANGLTVQVSYLVPSPPTWTSDAGTSLQVSVSVRDDERPEQKVYLTRSTVRLVVSDGSAYLPSPDPLVETANLNPGYLATAPYGYVQSFSVPGLDQSAEVVIIDVRLDLVSLVDAKARDYTKQSVTDSVRTLARR